MVYLLSSVITKVDACMYVCYLDYGKIFRKSLIGRMNNTVFAKLGLVLVWSDLSHIKIRPAKQAELN